MFTTKSGKFPHNHKVELDGAGDGKTIDTSYGPAHAHEVKSYSVLSCELSDDPHTHEVDVDGSKKWSAGDTPKVVDADEPVDPKKKPKNIKDKLDDIKEAQSIKIEVEISGQQPIPVSKD